jgi:hypothetical protein
MKGSSPSGITDEYTKPQQMLGSEIDIHKKNPHMKEQVVFLKNGDPGEKINGFYPKGSQVIDLWDEVAKSGIEVKNYWKTLSNGNWKSLANNIIGQYEKRLSGIPGLQKLTFMIDLTDLTKVFPEDKLNEMFKYILGNVSDKSKIKLLTFNRGVK